ncbi:hypothetical protein GYMLUDRAFT_262494 [Collybiopsis luxurians FD-317 M1]|uniref:Uncharacterized protein n=1 Tax=Collybiopsis luxurians FD-317 M1 TaxID=944289 RepID=A0A0D0CS24_9AGAR|nr:hypothetical protein GYMLUDRAFT_262494 [Collybiopsis luxurians FD-317 M1]
MADGDFLRLCRFGNVPTTDTGNESHLRRPWCVLNREVGPSPSLYPGPACPSIDIMAAGGASFCRALLATAIPTINAGSTGDGGDGSFNLGGLTSYVSCAGNYTLPTATLTLLPPSTTRIPSLISVLICGEAGSSLGGSGTGGPGSFGRIIISRLHHPARRQIIIRGHGMRGGFREGASGGAGGAHTPTLALLTGSSGLDGRMSGGGIVTCGDLHTRFINDMETQTGSRWALPCDGPGSGGLVKEGDHVEWEWCTAGTINGSNNIDNGGGRLSSHSVSPDFLVLITIFRSNPIQLPVLTLPFDAGITPAIGQGSHLHAVPSVSRSRSWCRAPSPYPGPASLDINSVTGGFGVGPQKTPRTRSGNGVSILTSTSPPLHGRAIAVLTISASSVGGGGDG